MKKSISDRMKVYLDRAEQLKPVVRQQQLHNRTSASATPTIATRPPSVIAQQQHTSSSNIFAQMPGMKLKVSLFDINI